MALKLFFPNMAIFDKSSRRGCTGGPHAPPPRQYQTCFMSSRTYLVTRIRMAPRNFIRHLPLGAEIQNGGQSSQVVTLTFFLWEIISKFFFLAWGLWLLAMQQNYFENRGRGILANSAIFSFFCGFSPILPIFQVFQHIKSKIWHI